MKKKRTEIEMPFDFARYIDYRMRQLTEIPYADISLKDDSPKNEDDKTGEEIKPDLPAKLIFLHLYKLTNTLDRTKHVNKVSRRTGWKVTSLVNAYRELEYFVNNDARLTEGQIRTFENYLEQLQDPEIIEKLNTLKLR